jgi:hypothetical protein
MNLRDKLASMRELIPLFSDNYTVSIRDMNVNVTRRIEGGLVDVTWECPDLCSGEFQYPSPVDVQRELLALGYDATTGIYHQAFVSLMGRTG